MANTNNTFINHSPAQMVPINKSVTLDGTEREFASVSFSCPESKSGYATCSINMGSYCPPPRRKEP